MCNILNKNERNMNQYQKFPCFPSSNQNMRFNGYPANPRPWFVGGGEGRPHPGTYFNNYQQRTRNPPYFLRYGPPPMRPAPPVDSGSCAWRYQRNPPPPLASPPRLHSPQKSFPSPVTIPRPRGPRTPSEPPPESEAETDTDFGRQLPSPPKKKSQKRHNKQKFRKQQQQEKYYAHPHQKVQSRRNSCPIQPQRRSSINQFNNNYNSSPTDSHKSKEVPSVLNTAVQAYLLQVLTSQPPPGSIQAPPLQENDTVPISYPSTMPALIHPPPPLPLKSQTPPPLPPSPIHIINPPPPPEDIHQEEPLVLNSNAIINERLGEKSNLSPYKSTSTLTIDIPNEEVLSIQEMENVAVPLVKIKTKRKKISARNGSLKDWTMEEALMALKVEQELSKEVNKDTILFLRFPDPPLSREMVKAYSDDIESVHFQQNSAPRFCFAHLKEGVNVDKIIETISKIPFGAGFVKAELRQLPALKSNSAIKAENIDPFTLYVGNLSTTIPCKVLKLHFPGAARIDIGFAQRMKYTRYAFVRYHKVEESIAAYRRMLNAEIEGRSLILRFRRFGATSKDGDPNNLGALHDDEDQVDEYSMISITPTIPSDIAESCETSIKEGLNESDNVQRAIHDIELNKRLVSDNHMIGDAVECETDPDGVPSPPVEREAECGTLVGLSQGTDINCEVESTADNMEQDVESCLNDAANNRQETEREKESTDAEIENVSAQSIRGTKSNTASPISPDSIRGSIDADVMVPSIPADSIKSEPNQSIDDIVVSNHTILRQNCDVNVKEESTLDDDLEFFSGGDSRRNSAAKILFADTETASVESESSDSCCSLSQVLRLYETKQDNSAAPPPAKRPKSMESHLIRGKEAGTTSMTRTEVKVEDHLPRHIPNNKENASLIKQENTVDDDILIIDSDDCLLQTINGEEEFILHSNVALNSNHRHRRRVVDHGDDDEVPPNAFLLRRSKETSKKLRVHPLLLKEEYVECEGNHSSRTMETQPSAPTKNDFSKSLIESANIARPAQIKPPLLAPDDDDDVVSDNNALCSRQSSIAFFDLTLEDEPVVTIKSEIETEDLFSLPKNPGRSKLLTQPTNSCNSEIKQENRRYNLRRNHAKSSKQAKAGHDQDDDDIVIIPDDATPGTCNTTTFSMSRAAHCLDQSEVLDMKRETPSPATSTIESLFENQKKSVIKLEKSFFGNHNISRHGDNLDRLFELLNSDSEEDL